MNNIKKVSFVHKLINSTGIECDASLITPESNQNIFSLSHSVLLEGIDFNLIYTPLKHLGYKAILSAIGPVYAAGYSPYSLSVKIALSNRFSENNIEELWQGMSAAMKEHNIQKISLDLLPSVTGLTISISSNGKQNRDTFVQLQQCKTGDLLCISGPLGEAYLGLQILEREKRVFEKANVQPQLENYKYVLQAYLHPFIDKTLFEVMAGNGIVPSEGDFIMYGLSDSIKKICARNSLGAKIFMNRIPVASEASATASELNLDPYTCALNGGDDYRFVFAIPLDKHEALSKELPQLDIIGHMSDSGTGALFITSDGSEMELKAQGWEE